MTHFLPRAHGIRQEHPLQGRSRLRVVITVGWIGGLAEVTLTQSPVRLVRFSSQVGNSSAAAFGHLLGKRDRRERKSLSCKDVIVITVMVLSVQRVVGRATSLSAFDTFLLTCDPKQVTSQTTL